MNYYFTIITRRATAFYIIWIRRFLLPLILLVLTFELSLLFTEMIWQIYVWSKFASQQITKSTEKLLLLFLRYVSGFSLTK